MNIEKIRLTAKEHRRLKQISNGNDEKKNEKEENVLIQNKLVKETILVKIPYDRGNNDLHAAVVMNGLVITEEGKEYLLLQKSKQIENRKQLIFWLISTVISIASLAASLLIND